MPAAASADSFELAGGIAVDQDIGRDGVGALPAVAIEHGEVTALADVRQPDVLLHLDGRGRRQHHRLVEARRGDHEGGRLEAVARRVVHQPVEDRRIGRHRDAGDASRAPIAQADLVVGDERASSSRCLSVGLRWMVRARSSLLFHVVRTTEFDPKVMPSDRVEPPVGRKRATDLERLISPSPDPAPRTGERGGRGGDRQREGQRDGHRDEDRPAAQVDDAIEAGIADPPAQPLRLLVEHVRPDEQEERRQAEHDEQGQLVLEVDRHVGDEQQPDDDDPR